MDKDIKTYFNLDKQEKESAISFLLESLIRSRNSSVTPSNKNGFDEDVNVYLAHLMLAFATQTYQTMVAKYLSIYDSDIRMLIENSNDRHVRYFIYKANADYLLIQLGVFQNVKGTIRFGQLKIEQPEEYFTQNAINYYQEAAIYNQKIYRKKTAVKDVLIKIADHFDDYRDLLKQTRRDYFHFMNQFQDDDFKHFVGSLEKFEQDIEYKELMNEFLDLYAKWLEDSNPDLVARIHVLIEAIKQKDPAFNFLLGEK